MTLNLPLLYFVWTEEYCQTSPNKNKPPNLWHLSLLYFWLQPSSDYSFCQFELYLFFLFFYFFFFASVSPPLGTEEKEVTQRGEILSESIFFIYRHLQFHQLRIQKVFYPIMVQLYIQWQNKHGKFTKNLFWYTVHTFL